MVLVDQSYRRQHSRIKLFNQGTSWLCIILLWAGRK